VTRAVHPCLQAMVPLSSLWVPQRCWRRQGRREKGKKTRRVQSSFRTLPHQIKEEKGGREEATGLRAVTYSRYYARRRVLREEKKKEGGGERGWPQSSTFLATQNLYRIGGRRRALVDRLPEGKKRKRGGKKKERGNTGNFRKRYQPTWRLFPGFKFERKGKKRRRSDRDVANVRLRANHLAAMAALCPFRPSLQKGRRGNGGSGLYCFCDVVRDLPQLDTPRLGDRRVELMKKKKRREPSRVRVYSLSTISSPKSAISSLGCSHSPGKEGRKEKRRKQKEVTTWVFAVQHFVARAGIVSKGDTTAEGKKKKRKRGRRRRAGNHDRYVHPDTFVPRWNFIRSSRRRKKERRGGVMLQRLAWVAGHPREDG